ncbi:MAG TPA: ATP-binding protein [Terriglobales bacterium]|nr:ATP-binding protein [Terriglobales bacterium]
MRAEVTYPLSPRSGATRLAATFVVWSTIWVVTSDYLLHAVAPRLSSWPLQTEKGLVYVAVSGLLLWLSVRAMERDEAERRALNESKRRRLEESGLIGVAGRAADGKIEYVNETFAQMLGYGYHELIGMQMSQLIPHTYTHLREKAEWHLRQFGRTGLFELELARKDGSLMPILGGRATLASAHGEEIAYFVDITELRRSEEERQQLHEQLLQSEKINALGQLAAGAAHDFNNELAVIIGYASALHAKLNKDEASRGNTSQILKAADRAKILIGQLLAFSREQPSNREVIDLNQAVREMHSMLRPLLNENIELHVIPNEQQECIEIDPTQLHQIIMNLVMNARDAMPNGGTLAIAVSRSAMDGFSKELPDKSREFVMLQVTDTGKGIDDSIKLRIFEPFFTTKKQSGGTGLGLATVYGIVKQNNGDIEVTSKLGQGSSFTIKFPRV